MGKSEALQRIGETVARGVAHDEAAQVRRRIESSTDHFKKEAAEKVEGVASQIRQLGMRFDRTDEAHALARRLERSADYLRFRPSAEVAGDAWHGLRGSRVLWVAGGAVVGALVYRLVRTGR
jgi:hypothetical protein